ncbi:MAG: ABC transporter ATP-binding protein [Victivallis sp.]
MSVECFCLTKRYGRRVVLDDVSLEINDGGVTGLIGPNGAGKSTLIKLITGLIWPTEGFVLVDGFDAHREHTKAMRRIGAVIEWPAFIPDLSARANLDIFSGGHGRAYREKRAEILRFMELESVLDRKVGSFSTGMRQRLGITLALLPDSEFIILDEPTNGLDPAGIVEIRQIIREYNRQFGVSVMVSSHLLSEVEQICGPPDPDRRRPAESVGGDRRTARQPSAAPAAHRPSGIGSRSPEAGRCRKRIAAVRHRERAGRHSARTRRILRRRGEPPARRERIQRHASRRRTADARKFLSQRNCGG